MFGLLPFSVVWFAKKRNVLFYDVLIDSFSSARFLKFGSILYTKSLKFSPVIIHLMSVTKILFFFLKNLVKLCFFFYI